MGEPGSHKQQREQLVRSLRAEGKSRVEVAEVLRERYRFNARVALRYAHEWSQRQAADEWNKRWPDELKTFKAFSCWEQWPSSTGHAPTFDNLTKLAELYKCAVRDLLSDLPDFRHLDTPSDRSLQTAANHVSEPDVSVQCDMAEWGVLAPLGLSQAAGPLGKRLHEIDFAELAQVIMMWIQRLNPSRNRRELLFKLSAALTATAAAPVFDGLNPDDHERVARFIVDSSAFEEPVLHYCEGMIINLKRQSNVLGPQPILPSTIGHRQMAQRLVKEAPESLRHRALSAYAELTHFVGWLCFNLGDYRSAQHYYDDARSAAHDAQNVELVTHVLCSMSQLATWQGKPRVGIDHAVAAAVWAEQAHSPLARAYAADVATQAYVADNQPDKCREALDREYAALQAASTGEPAAALWYFYDESFYWATEGECALKLRRPDAAVEALDKSLTLIDPADLHNYTFTLLFRAEARIQQTEITEASSIMGDVARITAGNTSQRIGQRLTQVRGLLVPWERTKPVRELDERLAVYRPAVGNGSGDTNRTDSR